MAQATAPVLKTAAEKLKEKYGTVKAKPAGDQPLKDGPYVFKLNYEKRGLKTLAPSQIVWDPESGRTREMRVIPGEPSIFKDEQKVDEKSVASGAIELWRPEFNDGFLNLNYPADAEKIKYMFLREDYDLKKKRIREGKIVFGWENKPVDESAVLNGAIALKAAMDAAFDAATNYESIVPHAKFLGIPFIDAYGVERKPASIVSDYIKASQADPVNFLRTMTSPVVKVSGLVEKAVAGGELVIDQENGIARWRSTNAIITQFDKKFEGVKYMAEWALSDDGEDFLQLINKQDKS